MSFEPHEPEQRTKLKSVLEAADITVGELWIAYFSMSGSVGEYEVHAYVEGLISLPMTQRDLLALACNELIDGTLPLRAPFADQVDGPANGTGG